MPQVRVKIRGITSLRAALSALLALVYGLGTIVLPSVHLGLHRNDHDHRGGGIHWHAAQLASQHDHTSGHDHAVESDASPSDSAETANADVSSLVDPRRPSPITSSISAPATSSAPAPGDPTHAGGSLSHFADSFLSHATQPVTPLVGPLEVPTATPRYASLALEDWTADARKARAPPRAAALL